MSDQEEVVGPILTFPKSNANNLSYFSKLAGKFHSILATSYEKNATLVLHS
jgi:hypothetical protein